MPFLRIAALFCACCLIACTGVSATTPATPAEPDATAPALTDGGDAHVSLQQNVGIRTYQVQGHSAGEIRDDLNRNHPYSPADGRRWDASTTWGLKWSFRFARDADSCSLDAATVEIDAVVQMPELADDPDTPAKVIASWQAYHDALQAHEMGHADRQVANAEALQHIYENAGPMANCNDLGAALNAAGEAQIAAGRTADLQYDQETDHGRLQGAVFP